MTSIRATNLSCLVCLLALAVTVPAWAGTYYVDVDWTGAANGTASEPYTNLAAAASQFAANGGTVYVAGGLYKSTSEGGYEDFGTTGYDIGVNDKAGTWKGGYPGWQGGTSFDWDDGSRVLPDAEVVNASTMTVVDLTNANSRAFYFSQYGVNIDFDGFLYRNADVSQSGYKGGAMYMHGNYDAAEVRNCVFINNHTTGDGGALYLTGRNGTSRDCVFIGNSSGGSGGGVWLRPGNGNQYVRRFTFRDNSAANGGGLYGANAIYVYDSVFENNQATGDGGGADSADNLYLYRCRIAGNSAGNRGGGVGGYEYGGLRLRLENCLVVGNTTGSGYAVHSLTGNDNAQVLCYYSTIANNTGSGGIYAHCNRSGTGGYEAQLVVSNSIVADNGGTGIRTEDTTPLIDYSDVYGHTTADYADQAVAGANDVSQPPLFVSTAVTNYHLQWASACVNSAADIGIVDDLDSVARPQHLGYDMGCYETIPPAMIRTDPATNVTGAGASLNGSLSDTNASPTYATVYWGPDDGGMTSWANTNELGSQAAGPVTESISLATNSTIYYRYLASNDLGVIWADETETLMTGAAWIETASHAAEGGLVPGTFTLHRAASVINVPVTVNVLVGGTATAGTHFVDFGSNVTFLAGASNATITVTPINDTGTQVDTTVTVTLVEGPNLVGSPSVAHMTIANVAPQTVTLTAVDPAADEQNQGTGMFTIARTGSSGDPVTVNYTVSGGATAGDYESSVVLSGSIVLAAGQTSTNITITPILDWYDEGSGEDFTLTLDAGAYDTGAPSSGTVTIADYNFSSPISTFYVDVNWTNDNGLGTASDPSRSLLRAHTAWDQVGYGFTVRIAGGVYESTAVGGLEEFGTGGYDTRGDSGTWIGGHAGWQGGVIFDWTAAAQTWPDADAVNDSTMTVIDLTNANARAFYGDAYGTHTDFRGIVFRNADVSQGSYHGGALHMRGGGYGGSDVRNCAFINNRTTGHGGGLYLGSRSSVSTNIAFINNYAGGDGGALAVGPGNGDQTLRTLRLVGNSAGGNGGGLQILSARVDVDRSTFTSNSAAGNGGGLHQEGASDATRCVFTDNTAGGVGSAAGGAEYTGRALLLENCLVTGNSGGTYAVASHCSYRSSSLTMRHTTLADNPSGGASVNWGNSEGSGVLNVRNSIIANNGGVGLMTDDAAPVIDYNDVFGNASAYGGTASAGANDIATDPLFADAGGGNYRLTVFSPCRDAGIDVGVTQDLDGNARPFSGKDAGFDLGCYEIEPPPDGTTILIR